MSAMHKPLNYTITEREMGGRFTLIAKAGLEEDARTIGKAIAATVPPTRTIYVETHDQLIEAYTGSAEVNFQ